MQPQIETSTVGISAIFPDGAVITITVMGRFPCTHCGDGQCKHLHAALPYWNKFKWEMAERDDNWGQGLLQSIGIVPAFIVRPEYFIGMNRRAPFGKGEKIVPGVRVWETVRGRLYRFGNEGHVYIGSDHPDGHTGCLICRGGCDHVARALALNAQRESSGQDPSEVTLPQSAYNRKEL